jgi:hypothetical protein
MPNPPVNILDRSHAEARCVTRLQLAVNILLFAVRAKECTFLAAHNRMRPAGLERDR